MPIDVLHWEFEVWCGRFIKYPYLWFTLWNNIVIVGPLSETNQGNKDILVAIEHYSKWCEAKAMQDHTIITIAKIFKKDIICRYWVLKYILIDNGGEWLVEFDNLGKVYGIQHQYITLKWPRCNGMIERLIKTIKHGIIVMSTLQDNTKTWDFQLPRVLYRYQCGVHANNFFYLFMVLIGRTLRLKANNFLNWLTQTFDEELGVEQ